MAFQILSREEIDLLNDQQKAQYDKELALYQQRAAFVEQIEKLEQVSIEPFKPKLVPIDVMEEVEFPSYHKPEYILEIYEPAKKPDIKVSSFKRLETIKPDLPVHDKMPEMEAEYTLKINPVQPDLPSIQKPVILGNSYQKINATSPDLPEWKSPKISAVKYRKPEMVKPRLQGIAKPSAVMQVNPYKTPAVTPPLLPAVSVSDAVTTDFQKPEISAIELPSALSPALSILSYQKIKREQPNLPEVSEIDLLVTPVFQKPEPAHIKTPGVVKTNREVTYFRKQKQAPPGLPKASVVKAATGKFRRLEPVRAELPAVSKVNVNIGLFEKPARKQPVLPETVKIRITDKEIIRMEASRADVGRVNPPFVPVITFAGPERTMPVLPSQGTPQIPDMDKKLEELMSVVHEEYRTF